MEWNNTKNPSYDVAVQKSGSKRRKTLCTHAYPEWELACSFTGLSKKQIDKIAGFFCSQYGPLKAFLWLDMEDYKQAGTLFGVGDGTMQRFQLMRTWGGLSYEPVLDIVPGTLVVYKNGVRTAVTLETDGIVYFDAPPAAGVKLTADFHYYWRVAFPKDITWPIIWYNLYKLNSFKLVSVR
jgi:uncharacterized protein (TIGR02217 family)